METGRIAIYPSRWKSAAVVAGAAVFVLLGLWIGSPGMARRIPIWEVAIAAWIGVPFFAACGLYALYRLVWRRPAVTLGPDGLIDTSSALGGTHLHWEEIDRAVLHRYWDQPMLGLVPRDLEGWLTRQSGPRRAQVKTNLALGIPPINIAQVGLAGKVTDLAEILRTRYGVRVEGSV
jgi:hypothetical protein